MKAKSYRLLVVAHPDDETIFFGGLLLQKRDLPWHVVCVTDGNADGRGKERAKEFKKAMKILGIKSFEHWDFPDLFPNRLDLQKLSANLQKFPTPKEAFTHGPLGEYGHPHHQDVCLAVHRTFNKKCKIFAPAWNVPTELAIKLTAKQFSIKSKAFLGTYYKETSRFLNVVPNSSLEGFHQFSLVEVEALVGFIRRERELKKNHLKSYRWLAELLPNLRDRLETRLF